MLQSASAHNTRGRQVTFARLSEINHVHHDRCTLLTIIRRVNKWLSLTSCFMSVAGSSVSDCSRSLAAPTALGQPLSLSFTALAGAKVSFFEAAI